MAGRLGYVTNDKLDRVEALIAWAAERGRTVLEVAVGALAAQDGCACVIAGATTPEQVKANAPPRNGCPPLRNLPTWTASCRLPPAVSGGHLIVLAYAVLSRTGR